MSLREGGDLWLTCFIAFRFLTRGQNRFALLVTWLSITGLSLGVALLTLVVSVMSGFDQELRQRLLEMVPHVRMLEPQEKDRVSEFLVDDERVSSIHKYFLASGALRSASGVRPIQIYGIDGEGLSKISPVFKEIAPLKAQEFRTTLNGVLLGAPIAELLGLRVGDLSKLVVVVSDSKGIKPEILNYRLVDTFEVGGDPDYGLALVNLDSQTSSRWERLGETGIEIKLHDPAQALQMSLLLETEFPDAQLHTWTDTYGQLFDAIRLEKSMMFLLLLLFENKNLHQGLRRGNHCISGDAELFVDSRGRGGGAEAISADGFDRVFSPAKGGGSFDGDSALAVGRDERLSVSITLLFEQFPARHGDYTNLLAFRGELLASNARQLQFSTRSHQDAVNRFTGGFTLDDVRTLCDAFFRGTRQVRNNLSGQGQSRRSLVGGTFNGDLVRTHGFVTIGRTHHKHTRHGSVRGQVLNRLVSRSVFPDANGIVGHDINDALLHQCR